MLIRFLFPSLRFCIDSPTLRNSVRLQGQRKPKHSFLNFGTLAYFNEVLARFSEVPPTKYPFWIPRGLRGHSGSIPISLSDRVMNAVGLDSHLSSSLSISIIH